MQYVPRLRHPSPRHSPRRAARLAWAAWPVALACAALLAGPAASGDDDAPPGEAPGLSEARSQKPPLYTPPRPSRGDLPKNREGAATRGFEKGKTPPAVLALSPDHVGLTGTAQPILYWFIEGDSDAGVVVTLLEKGGDEPLLELEIPGPVERGIHPVRLADHGVRLEEGVAYAWFAASAQAADRPSAGYIVFEPLPASVRQEVDASPAEAAHAYARNGFWYDAFAASSQRAESDPAARLDRAALLAQVQLDGVADAEWEAAGAYGDAASP